MGRLTWEPSHIFFPWACSQSWLPQPLGFKGPTLRSIDTIHVMFLISCHVSLCKILFIHFFNARLCPWIRPSPKPIAHPPLEGCPVRRALPYTSSLSIQVVWQTFTTVSTWAAEMSLNCLFLGQPIFNLLPLPIEETIRLRCFNFWKQMEESIAKTIRLVLELTIVPPGPAPLLPSFCWPSSYPLAGLALKYELQ